MARKESDYSKEDKKHPDKSFEFRECAFGVYEDIAPWLNEQREYGTVEVIDVSFRPQIDNPVVVLIKVTPKLK